MRRAVELFAFEERSSSSPLVSITWHTRSEPEESFISVAVSHWEMVVTRQAAAAWLTVRGPETKELPQPDNADVFFDRLVRAGLLVHDPVASAAVQDGVEGLSTRSVERRVARATGLTRGAIRQIRRAERAVELLGRRVPALDVARQAGYADQPHLTRSLKRFVRQTPSQIGANS
jgi:hypothetical protein